VLSGFSDSTSMLTFRPAGLRDLLRRRHRLDRRDLRTTRVGRRRHQLAPIGQPWLGISAFASASGGRFRAGRLADGKDSTTTIGGYQVRWSVDNGLEQQGRPSDPDRIERAQFAVGHTLSRPGRQRRGRELEP
jgi:hypothetical protein